jgi:hypothetical protein
MSDGIFLELEKAVAAALEPLRIPVPLNGTVATTSGTTLTLGASGRLAINDVIRVDLERMLVTGIGTLSATVTRGYGSTIAAAHNLAAVWRLGGATWSQVFQSAAAGYLLDVHRFRGKVQSFAREFAEQAPCAVVGVLEPWAWTWDPEGRKALTPTVTVALFDDSSRNEEEIVEGSGVSSEGPGLYQMMEDAAALCEGMTVQSTAYGGLTIPGDVIAGGVTLDNEKIPPHAFVQIAFRLPSFVFKTAYRSSRVRF